MLLQNGDDGMKLLDNAMRLSFYGGVIAIFLMIVALVVKLLWNYDGDETNDAEDSRTNETSRLLLSEKKGVLNFYGTSEDDLESGKISRSSSSSNDLYDEKICAICYDDQRSCLFVPCGHCITCCNCASRIIKDENKTCPICRTIIHKVKKLQIL